LEELAAKRPRRKRAERAGFDTSRWKKEMGLALGQGEVTVLEMARFAAEVVNGGRAVSGRPVDVAVDPAGRVRVPAAAAGDPVMTPQAAALTRDLMRLVVEYGTGGRARIPGRDVVMDDIMMLNEDYKEMFYAGAAARKVPRKVVDEVWEMILSFSGYSFCKPHSASYALVSYKSCYLRAHYPAEFIAAVLTNQGGYYSPFAYVSEARRMGLLVLLPDVNESRKEYWGKDKAVRVGLMQLKGLREAALEAVLEERKKGPFRSFDDFLNRVDIDMADVKIFVKAGATDSISGGATRPEMIWKALAWHETRLSRRPVVRSSVPLQRIIPVRTGGVMGVHLAVSVPTRRRLWIMANKLDPIFIPQ